MPDMPPNPAMSINATLFEKGVSVVMIKKTASNDGNESHCCTMLSRKNRSCKILRVDALALDVMRAIKLGIWLEC